MATVKLSQVMNHIKDLYQKESELLRQQALAFIALLRTLPLAAL